MANSPTLKQGERVLWSCPGARLGSDRRVVSGGRLYVTDHRVVFCPQPPLGAKRSEAFYWEVPLSAVTGVEGRLPYKGDVLPGIRRRLLYIYTAQGRERFGMSILFWYRLDQAVSTLQPLVEAEGALPAEPDSATQAARQQDQKSTQAALQGPAEPQAWRVPAYKRVIGALTAVMVLGIACFISVLVPTPRNLLIVWACLGFWCWEVWRYTVVPIVRAERENLVICNPLGHFEIPWGDVASVQATTNGLVIGRNSGGVVVAKVLRTPGKGHREKPEDVARTLRAIARLGSVP